MGMLVLSRKDGQGISIKYHGAEIIVKVLSFRGNKVRMGFDAPHDAKIARDDLHPKGLEVTSEIPKDCEHDTQNSVSV